MKSTTRRNFMIAGTAAAAAVGGALHHYSERYSSVITRWWSGTFTEPEVTEGAITADQAKANAVAISEEIANEGMVLLKNKDNFLPQPAGKLALLGYSSLNPVYIGAGSVSQGDGSTELIDFWKAFERAGYDVNQDMRTWYEGDGAAKREGTNMFMMMGSDYNVYDQPVANYRAYLDAAAAHADTAVVVFARQGGEGGDLPIDMSSYQNGDAGEHYLKLQSTERELLDYAMENFDHVVVMLDSANAMNVDFLDDDRIDAAFWVGAPGSVGIAALPRIMTGEVNPSGRLVDILPKEQKSNPTYYTCTAGTYNNYEEFIDDVVFDNMVDEGVTWYPEGIYVGYRYYETAAAEGTIDYDQTVGFPFGFGLSYTTFDWKVAETRLGGLHEQIEIDVNVTNTGDRAGKDVVELYVEAPYTPGGIEKAARSLAAFAKTSELAPGASETVTLSFPADELASYDYKNERCYVADAGEYKLHLQTDSHNDKAGVDPVIYTVDSTRVYKDEGGVGARSTDFVAAVNHFDAASMGDGNVGDGAPVPWMTRQDLAGTHPEKTMGKHITEMDFGMGDDCIDYMLNRSLGGSDIAWEDDENYVTESKIPVANDEKNGLTCDDLAGLTDWDDPIWDQLVNQMSIDEQVALVCDCGYGTPEIESIGKRLATDVDGPAGISSMNLNYFGHQYCGEPVTTATWNVELAERMGVCVGDECCAAAVNGWYAPGADFHRTAFGGRNAEYYAEDPVLGGKISAAEVRGVQSKGVYVYIKHFVMNDQDNKRGGMYTWAHEQAIRELYLRMFEYPVKEGGAKAVMYAYNRIGPMECCVCRALTTNVLHQEWGSHCSGLTDGYGAGEFAARGQEDGFRQQAHGAMYENPDLQIRAGGGQLLFLGGWNGLKGITEATTGSEKGREMLHDQCRRMLYIYCNSNAMTTKRDYTPYWKYVRTGVYGVLGAAVAGGWINHAVKSGKEKKRKAMIAEQAAARVETDEITPVYITDDRTFMRAGYKEQLAVCPSCGAAIEPQDSFCHECGAKIAK